MPPPPDPALRLLDRFVGTRDMQGRTLDSEVDAVTGRATFSGGCRRTPGREGPGNVAYDIWGGRPPADDG